MDVTIHRFFFENPNERGEYYLISEKRISSRGNVVAGTGI